MENKVKYIITCCFPNHYYTDTIECREMTIKEGAYTFWEGKYGEEYKIIASYPIRSTIVKRVKENE